MHDTQGYLNIYNEKKNTDFKENLLIIKKKKVLQMSHLREGKSMSTVPGTVYTLFKLLIHLAKELFSPPALRAFY